MFSQPPGLWLGDVASRQSGMGQRLVHSLTARLHRIFDKRLDVPSHLLLLHCNRQSGIDGYESELLAQAFVLLQ